MGNKKRPGRASRYPGITDLGDGRYRLRAYRTCPTSGRQREVERLVRAESVDGALRLKIDLEVELGRVSDGGSKRQRKLGEAAAEWLERKLTQRRRGELALAPTTRERYRRSVGDHIVPYLGGYTVASLERRHVKRWLEHLGGHYAAATANGHLRVLRDILADAGNAEAGRVRALPEEDSRITDEEPNVLEGDEVSRFVEATRRLCPQHHALVLVLLTSAVRISTALALRREDFDPEHGVIRVRRRRSGGEVLPGVKRSRKARDLPGLDPYVWDVVQAHWAGFSAEQSASGLAFPSERNGGFQSRSVLNRWIPKILGLAGIKKRFTPHGCRRTSANVVRSTAGEAAAMRHAGHLTAEMHRRYTPDLAGEARSRVERSFQGMLRPETGDGAGDADGPGGGIPTDTVH